MKTFLKGILAFIIGAAIIMGMLLGIELICVGVAWLVIFLESSTIGKIIAWIILGIILIIIAFILILLALILGIEIVNNASMAIKKFKNKRVNL